MWRRPGLTPAGESFDDDHVPTTAWARRTDVERLFRWVIVGGQSDCEQFAYAREIGRARRSGEYAVVTDAMEPWWQHVEQEAADEFVGSEWR